jgi:hypothetical protein
MSFEAPRGAARHVGARPSRDEAALRHAVRAAPRCGASLRWNTTRLDGPCMRCRGCRRWRGASRAGGGAFATRAHGGAAGAAIVTLL